MPSSNSSVTDQAVKAVNNLCRQRPQNVSIAIVGPKTPLRIIEDGELARYLSLVEGEERRGGSGSATGDAAPADDQPGEPRDPQVAVR